MKLDIKTQHEALKAWGEEADRRWKLHLADGINTVDAFAAIDDARQQIKHRRAQ